MKVLTFIIPAYNSAAYLDRCVSSMLTPEVLEKLEIIIVSDGSTDATEEIALRFCRRYPNTVRLISQENRGHGGALNAGCAEARGKYLKVIDADDWVETQNLPEFVRLLEQCGSDVVLTHYYTIDIGTGEIKNWSELGGKDEAIVVIGREAGSGTRDVIGSVTGAPGIKKRSGYASRNS